MAKRTEIVIRSVREARGTPPEGEIWINSGELDHQCALSIFKKGLDALRGGSNYSRPPERDGTGNETPVRIIVLVMTIPTLDDMLAATFTQWLLENRTLPPAAEPFAQYAALTREGYIPGKIPPELSLAAIYQFICWELGNEWQENENLTSFLRDWQRIADVLWKSIEEKKDPFTDPLFSEEAGFGNEIENLRSDRSIYTQDLKQAIHYRIYLGNESRECSALILKSPRSLLFKHWAHGDTASPTGDGYLLLGVQWKPSHWVFSNDPAQRLTLKTLSDAFTQAELAAPQMLDSHQATPPHWFDGAAFHHTLIASPKGGSRLDEKEVLHVFEKWAKAKRITKRKQPPTWLQAALAACMLALIGGLAWGTFRHHDDASNPSDLSSSATELDELHVRALPSRGSNATRGNIALFVGVNEFRKDEFPRLTYAVDDALAQAHLFVIELDLIPPTHTVLAIEGVPGTRRAEKQLHELIAAGIKPIDANTADVVAGLKSLADTTTTSEGNGLMIVSISAHGMENGDGAYVIMHDSLRERLKTTALAVDQLNDSMHEAHVSKRLLFVDACREATNGISRDVELPGENSFFQALTAAKGQKVMSSCSSGQLSYEVPAKGHGIFTYWLLMGLKGEAAADARGLITVGTVQSFLKTKVHDFSAHYAPGIQEPWFSASDSSDDIPLAVAAAK